MKEIAANNAYPASQKIYAQTNLPDVRVAMRQISLSPSKTVTGTKENAPVMVYDTSGPHSDPEITINIRKGLPALKRPWILGRRETPLKRKTIFPPLRNHRSKSFQEGLEQKF